MEWYSWITLFISIVSFIFSICAYIMSWKDKKQEKRVTNLELDATLRPYRKVERKITSILDEIDDVSPTEERKSYFSLFSNMSYLIEEIKDSDLEEVKQHNSDLDLIRKRMNNTKSVDFNQVMGFLSAAKDPLSNLRLDIRVKIENIENRKNK
ncbi:hypothetical protein ACUIJQ_08130 [Levilactobacillus hammesii]|uniref:Uncharacterized protein n=1 Tax=Levilactobacillus hammesii DSM 16381 TaxID=1423753 RepID=A0A0R1UQV2_9LACO|nr:hypothetical protein [Levilactobacillus hammesii]KRL95585.1 hypothetical protein FD28_GL002559 [Levilactobacillus hammesii DSM 16381]